MSLKLIPKPDGFEWRDKLSNKRGSAHWTPKDAMYDAYERIKDKEVTQLVVTWWQRDEAGREVLKFSQSTTCYSEHHLLLHKALQDLERP